MALPGGPADKIGNRYERRWAVRALIDLLRGTATSVRFEVPGSEGKGTEFRRTDAHGHGWHQVKRQTSKGSWNITALVPVGVMDTMWAKASIGERFTFVSGVGVAALGELTDRARDAASFDEFTGAFLDSADLKAALRKVETTWKTDAAAAFAALRLIDIRVIDEESLEGWNLDILRPLVTDPENAADVLSQLVDDSLHKDLTDADVWAHLQARGFTRASFITDPTLATRIDRTATERLALLRPRYVNDIEIPRSETDEAIAALTGHPAVALVGGAGSGKSVVVAGVIEWSRSQGRPTLVISADRLPTPPSVPGLGAELGLGGSPVAALAGVARGRPATLVIDQLDAVSVISGRNPGGTDVIHSLLTEARSHDNIKVVVACRQFDLDNDRGLSTVAITKTTEVIKIPPLTAEQVAGAIALAGLPAVSSERLLRLLQLPITLAIYTEVSKATGADLTSSRTLTDLYSEYWNEKQRKCRRAGAADQWIPTIDLLIDAMVQNKSLTVPIALLDEYGEQRDTMISEGVLVGDAHRIGFLHETFFDYVFARRFVGRNRTLQADLGDQDLFSRARVRQVLAYQRSTSTPNYVSDLNWLLHTSTVRLHLKDLVIGLFETVDDPTDDEWAAMEPIASDPGHSLHHPLMIALRRNPGWFETMDRHGIWERDLRGSDDDVQRALWLLSGPSCVLHGERTVELTRVVDRDAWRRFRHGFFQRASPNWSSHLDPSLLEAVGEGDYDTDPQGELWFVMHGLPAASPASAAGVIEALLARGIATLADGETDPFKREGPLGRGAHGRSERVIESTARQAPTEFATRLVPLIVQIAEANVRADWDPEPFKPDSTWFTHHWGAAYKVSDELLDSTMIATALFAKEDPQAVRPLLTGLQDKELRTVGLIVAAGYAGNPEAFADDAVSWMETHPGTLYLGYSNCTWWATRKLIEAISPVCSDATLARLEDAVLFAAPRHERTKHGFRSRGSTELGLLNGIDEDRRSERVRRRLRELRRKFNRNDWAQPSSALGGAVGPPIPVDRAKFMSDAQWLRAIEVHSNPETQFRPDREPTGGAGSQANVLESLTEEKPQRFARLLLKIPASSPAVYIDGILRGLAKAPVDIDLLQKVVACALSFGPDVEHAVAQAIESHSTLPVPTELLDVLVQLIDQVPGKLNLTGTEPVGLDPVALYTTPATALRALWNMVAEDHGRFGHVRNTLERLAGDSRPDVRAMLAGALTPVLYIDDDFALRVFLATMANNPPQLLGSQPVVAFILHAVRRGRYADIEPVINAMLSSDVDDILKIGARQLSLASFDDEGLDPRVDELLADARVPVREAAVEVFARSVGYAPRRQRSVAVVAAALGDPASEVRNAAGQVFHETPGLPFDDLGPLLTAMTSSEAVTAHSGTMAFHWLANSRRPLPVAALNVCEAFVTAAGAAIGDIATHAAADATEIVRIVLRLHTQYHDFAIRSRCLDLIDRLLLYRAHGIEEGLDEHDG